MSLKVQRNLWCFAGICFMLNFVLRIYDGYKFNLGYVLLITTAGLQFLNAYNIHKRMRQEKK